jgi:predicted dehydrogenase
MMPAFGFEMSFNIMLEKATIVYDCTREPAFRVCPAEGEAFTPEVPAGDGYSRQIEHFVKTINGQEVPDVTTLAQSMESVRIVLAEIESAKTGQTVSL